MKLNRQDINIHPSKLNNYLLDVNHIDGGAKARLLMSFGFTYDGISMLHDAIILHATMNDYGVLKETKFGHKYIVEGDLLTPIGRFLKIRSIWIKKSQEEIIKFVTLYPL